MYSAHGIFALTPEVGPSDAEVISAVGNRNYGDDFYEYGFWPPAGRIPLIANETTTANIRLAWLAGDCFKASIKAATAVSTEGESTLKLAVTVANVGVASAASEAGRSSLVVAFVLEHAGSGSDSKADGNAKDTTYDVINYTKIEPSRVPVRGANTVAMLSGFQEHLPIWWYFKWTPAIRWRRPVV